MNTATTATGRRRSRRILESHINMPKWLEPKIGPLLHKAETKETFFARMARSWPPTSPEYLLIKRAYEAAEQAFRGKRRNSGGEYFDEHLRGSALILHDYMRVKEPNIISGVLLHDNIEDCPEEWNFDRMVTDFNTEVAEIVWWNTKPPKENGMTDEDVDREYRVKLWRAPRKAMFVKLPERLHNIITIHGQPVGKIESKLIETRDVIVPLTEEHHILIHEFEDVLAIAEEKLRISS